MGTIRYAQVARNIVDGCCQLHPVGALTLTELVSLIGTEEEEAWFVGESVERKRVNRVDKLLMAVNELLADYVERRLAPPLVESELARGSFLYAYQDDPYLSPGERSTRARYRLHAELRQLLVALDDTAFERLCGRILQEVGCIGITVTDASKDKGLDFIAKLPLTAATTLTDGSSLPPFFRLVGGVAFMVYGQAKRYSFDDAVGREPVGQLEGDWRNLVAELVNNEIDAPRLNALQRAKFKLGDPVILIVATTSRFTSGALATAKNLGIVTLDGEQLAQFLVDGGVGVAEADSYSWRTDRALLEAACEWP